MPLKRSPPVKKAARSSENRMSESSDNYCEKSETPTFKKKHALVNSPNRDDFDGLLAAFESYKKQQEAKYNGLMQKLTEIKEENKQSQTSIEFLSKEYEDMKEQFKLLHTEKREDRAYIQTLEDKIAILEKNFRSSGLEIRNVPMPKSETKYELSQYIIDIGNAINQPVESVSDIRNVFRTNGKNVVNRPIIVDFTSTVKKEKFLKSVKLFKKVRSDSRLNSSHLHLNGPAMPVYVSESLSLKTKGQFALARDFSKTNEYTFCWVAHGQVYIRKKKGVPSTRITTEADLKKILEQQ